MKFSHEPVVYLNLLRAVLALVVVFGLSLPIGGAAAVMAVAEVVITVFTRSQVSPATPSNSDTPSETVGMDAP